MSQVLVGRVRKRAMLGDDHGPGRPGGHPHGHPGHVLHAADEHDVGEAHGDLHESDLDAGHGRAALLVDKLGRDRFGRLARTDRVRPP